MSYKNEALFEYRCTQSLSHGAPAHNGNQWREFTLCKDCSKRLRDIHSLELYEHEPPRLHRDLPIDVRIALVEREIDELAQQLNEFKRTEQEKQTSKKEKKEQKKFKREKWLILKAKLRELDEFKL